MVFQIKEAVSEAEASLPEIVAILSAGTSPQGMQQGMQAFINDALVRVSGGGERKRKEKVKVKASKQAQEHWTAV